MKALSFQTSFGYCHIAWSDEGLLSFRLPGGGPPALAGDSDAVVVPSWIQDIVARVRLHLDGNLQDFADLRYHFATVSSFQRAVYKAALEVKAGQTQTYGWLAQRSGHPVSVSRAVGTALGQNPWPLLVPCHRFVGANGKMVGFSAPGGISTKLRLLAREGAQLFAQ